MIGRFASGLGDRLPATLVAGAILTALGAWFASDPWRRDYPAPSDLVAFEGEAFDAIEVRKRRGGLAPFATEEALELQAVLNPGERLVLYTDAMPRYEAVKQAVASGPAVYRLWEGAREETDRMLIWGIDDEAGIAVAPAETVAALREARAGTARLPAAIGVCGLVLLWLGLRARARAMAGRSGLRRD